VKVDAIAAGDAWRATPLEAFMAGAVVAASLFLAFVIVASPPGLVAADAQRAARETVAAHFPSPWNKESLIAS
jgi:hypothetical protein